MTVDGQGQLVVQTAGGGVRWNKPEIYQEVDGQHRSVKGKYVLRAGHELGFAVAAYDTARPLIIDPALVYSTYLGGSGGEEATASRWTPPATSTWQGPRIRSTFPRPPGAFQTAKGSSVSYVFVTKLDPTGSRLAYSTYLGGNSSNKLNGAYGIAVDTSGNAYVTGFTYSTDYPTTPGAFQTTFGGDEDGFVTELNPTGSGLIYSTYLGGNNSDLCSGIAVDTFGNAYVTGFTGGGDFPTTAGSFQLTNQGEYDAFVTELNPTGSDLAYSTYLGGSGTDFANGIAVDTSGNAYVTGFTGGDDFPTTPGAFQTTSSNSVAFITEFNPTGSGLVYSTFLGGSGGGQGADIAVGPLWQRLRYGIHVFERLSHHRGSLSDDLAWFQECLCD